MITWGYIKQATLAKMDLSVDAAVDQGLIEKMPFYANEALTEITSAIKAKRAYADFKVADRDAVLKCIAQTYGQDAMYFVLDHSCDLSTATEDQLNALKVYEHYVYVGDTIKMPDDFVAWSDDTNWKVTKDCSGRDTLEQLKDTEFAQRGNKLIFMKPCICKIAYFAKWFFFTPTTQDDVELDIPDDILVCLPSYIASQLFKIDDEQKSSIYRNEYEMALARINENDYATNKVINNGGDW